jgi:clan AA aspartic protease (TIGR02281 family)
MILFIACVKMAQVKLKIVSYWCLCLFLSLDITACNSSKIATQIEPKVSPIVTPDPIVSPPPVQQNNGLEIYQQALARADAANAIGQSALSKDDWFLVVNNLEDSVHLLKSIAPNSSEYILAVKVLPKYERELITARQKATGFRRKLEPKVANAPQIATLPQSNTFSIPIAQKLGGIPVIEVSFNSQKVLMLLDTGASRTLITKSIAQRLQLQTTGSATAKTANGTATFSTATIDKIKFGDGETNDVMIAVGQNDLPYGLLGHDVYDGYDITIKENSIEFHKR